jgi:hypothetical protein
MDHKNDGVRVDRGQANPVGRHELEAVVSEILAATPVIDIHTHLFPPSFGKLGLSGIDELLTYHYLEAELFRFASISPADYWALSKSEKADLVWRTLFLDNTPISEATRGVVAVLDALGLDPTVSTLDPLRAFFREQDEAAYLERVFDLAGVSDVVMTNDPLDEAETGFWNPGTSSGERFHPALRVDRILNEWAEHQDQFAALGFTVDLEASPSAQTSVRKFLSEWVARIDPLYMAVSLPDTFDFPVDDVRTRLLEGAVLPACREYEIPIALMIGVRRQVNPDLRMAGDASGRSDLKSIAALCEQFPDNRFLVSALSRENQHELCVYARKFPNLLPFGCWWFLNNPSIVSEITSERLEMLGTSFIPQHSDARILEQLIYKWRNTRRTVAPVLAHAFGLLLDDGGSISRADIQRDVRRLFRTNFESWTGWKSNDR